MKEIFITEIRERDRIEEIFLVNKKEMPISKGGKPYLNLKIMDRTGELEGRVWENARELAGEFERDDFVMIKAWAVSYQGRLQLNISSIERYPEEKVSFEDFLPSAAVDTEEMMKELETLIQGMNNKYLKKLLELFVADKGIRDIWKKAPAAKTMHHTYLGGMLEHTLSLSRLALDVSRHYRVKGSKVAINEDLLLTGAILHDIGKIHELSYSRSFGYTDVGRLLGHITIGVEMIEKKITEIPDFPAELTMLLKHMILSHHGYLEYGSPKRPKTLEAIILYYLDDMDSKIESIQAFIAEEKGGDPRWTRYHRLYDRYIYKGDGLQKPHHGHSNEPSSDKEPTAEKTGEHKEDMDRDLFAKCKMTKPL